MSTVSRYFVVVGEVHGAMHRMASRCHALEQRSGRVLQFVLQVGNFEPNRDSADLATMAAHSREKVLGDFPDFASGKAHFPWEVIFIGGAHEPYGMLEQYPEGGTLVENCTYLGRAGCVEREGLRIGGLSGIYCEPYYNADRPPLADMAHVSKKLYTYFNTHDVDRLLDLAPLDVLLLHEWPAGIIRPADLPRLQEQAHRLHLDSVDSPVLRELVDLLRPRWIFCGRLQTSYLVKLGPAKNPTTHVRCLGALAGPDPALSLMCYHQDMIWEATTG